MRGLRDAPDNPKPDLIRAIGLTGAVLLFVSSIIGSGVYKKVVPMTDALHSGAWVLLAWLVAGLVTLAGALTTMELSSMVTGSGGPYAYFKRIYGSWFAFLFGWGCFAVLQSASIASIAYVFAQSIDSMLQLPLAPAAWEKIQILGIHPFANAGVKTLAVALILALTWLNARGVRHGARLSGAITGVVLLSMVAIVCVALVFSDGSFSNVTAHASDYPPDTFATGWGHAEAFFAAMLGAFWAYQGWVSLGFVAEEVRNPQRTIPIALVLGTLLVIAIYLAVNIAYLYVLPADRMLELSRGENTIAAIAVMQEVLGRPGAIAISVLIAVTTLGCTNTTILTAGRIYYGMARDGLFVARAARVHPRFHTPSQSLWMQGGWASVLVVSGSFDALTDMLIVASFVFYGALAVGVVVLRIREPAAPRPYRVIGYPLVPALFAAFCVLLVVVSSYTAPRAALTGLLLIAAGLPLQWLRIRRET